MLALSSVAARGAAAAKATAPGSKSSAAPRVVALGPDAAARVTSGSVPTTALPRPRSIPAEMLKMEPVAHPDSEVDRRIARLPNAV